MGRGVQKGNEERFGDGVIVSETLYLHIQKHAINLADEIGSLKKYDYNIVSKYLNRIVEDIEKENI